MMRKRRRRMNEPRSMRRQTRMLCARNDLTKTKNGGKKFERLQKLRNRSVAVKQKRPR